jgi:hypothetical protein
MRGWLTNAFGSYNFLYQTVIGAAFSAQFFRLRDKTKATR